MRLVYTYTLATVFTKINIYIYYYLLYYLLYIHCDWGITYYITKCDKITESNFFGLSHTVNWRNCTWLCKMDLGYRFRDRNLVKIDRQEPKFSCDHIIFSHSVIYHPVYQGANVFKTNNLINIIIATQNNNLKIK